MVEVGLLLQNSDFIPVTQFTGWWWLHACSASAEFAQSPPDSAAFGAPSFAYPGTCLSGLHKKLGNLHMGPGTQLLPALLHVGVRSFGLTSSCLRVVLGRKETLNPSGVRTHCTASDRPCTYGRVTTGPRECSSAGLVGAGVA